MSTENKQFGPIYKLSLFREDGAGVTIDPPACIEFQAELDRLPEPNKVTIQVYNINDEMRANIAANDFGLIRLEAGYEQANNMAVIFEGNIRKTRVRERIAEDIVTTIIAGEGDLAWRRVTIENTFASGTTFIEMARFCIERMPNITEGDLSGLEGFSINAPYTVSGAVRNFFNDLSDTSNARWSMQRTSLDFVSNEQARNIFTVNKKTYDTGLFEAELDETGIEAFMALDPALKPNGIVEIESMSEGTSGFWRIDSVRHVGSFGGQGGVWESQITGQRREGIDRITGQGERATFTS